MDLIKLLCFIEPHRRVSSFTFMVYGFEIDISINIKSARIFFEKFTVKKLQRSALPDNVLSKTFKNNN